MFFFTKTQFKQQNYRHCTNQVKHENHCPVDERSRISLLPIPPLHDSTFLATPNYEI